jgi:hypothetical protein
MNAECFELMEVKPKEKSFYFVTLFQFQKDEPEHRSYIRDWLEFDGDNWVYDHYEGNYYVCFIHKRDDTLYQVIGLVEESMNI